MKLKLTWLLTLFMAFVMQFSFSQERDITGTVTGADDGFPLPGVNVIVKGTQRGTQTDFDGNYSIKASAGEVLVFSFVGYETAQIPVGASNSINVSMESGNVLEEIVVTGYKGATNSAKVASSLSTVDGKDIEQIPINSIDQMLQGAAAGVNVSTNSGQPGQSGTIIIRGRGSLTGDIEPLFVIDGVPVDQDNFRSLNQNDIESLSVLKDAAATAIYGNRGAGGVILITTKKGKKGTGVNVQYRNLTGFAVAPSPQFEVMSTRQLFTFHRDILGSGLGSTLTPAQFDAISNQRNTRWTDIFLRTGVTNSHELNVQVGSENVSSYTSVNFFEQEGVTLGSDLRRFSFRNNFNGSSKDNKFNFTTGLTMNYSVSNFIVDAARGGNTGGQLDNPFIVPYIGLPYLSPYNPDGSINIFGNAQSGAFVNGQLNANGANGFLNTPFLALNTASLNTDQESEIKIVANIGGDYNFAKNFRAGAYFGIDYTNIENLRITTPGSIRGLITPNAAAESKGSQNEGFFRQLNVITNANINYNNEIADKLTFDASVYGEYNYTNAQNAGFTAFGLNPALPGSGTGFTDGNTTEGEDNDVYNYIPSVFSAESELALVSVFATADFDYDSRYGISATIRRDGTSRFPENIWGTFWSVAGRWNLNNEAFMEDATWINNLKLRASYGVVGNQNTGSRYQGRQTIAANPGYQLAQGYAVAAFRDTDIQWETTYQFNVGLSFGLWQNRLSGEIDFYDYETRDLFVNDLISLAGTGFGSVNRNGGTLTNTGVDLQLAWDVLRQTRDNPWGITLRANGNYNKNEVTSLPGGFTGNTLRIAEGRQAFTWFLPRWAGVDPSNGQALYLDVNGDVTNVFTPSNGVYLDKNFDPKYTGGFGGDITYKGFSLNALFSFQADAWRLNGSYSLLEDVGVATFANLSTSMLRAWTTPGQITDVPATRFGGLRFQSGDRYLEDASFLRLRNLSLAYNFNKELLARTNFFTGVRVFVQGTNLYTWTKWRGFDPESTRASTFFDYPVPRTYSIGVDLNF